MIAECYDLSVQCDDGRHVLPRRQSWQGSNRRDCYRQARAAGWLLDGRNGAVCASCAPDEGKGAAAAPVDPEAPRYEAVRVQAGGPSPFLVIDDLVSEDDTPEQRAKMLAWWEATRPK